MGLFWSLQPDPPAPISPLPEPLPRTETDQLSVELDGRTVATRRLARRLVGPGVTEKQLRPDQGGFYGDFFTPAHRGRRPAVLVLGGSEGGLARPSRLIAAQLASHGYPALALAYFQEPGLPSSLTNIPLEYFAGALQWLSHAPAVDPHHILVRGVSRGSEAALLLGVHYPDLVAGVIATSPSSVVNTGLPDVNKPAWTVGGEPLPFVPFDDFKQPNPPRAPEAVIPVEQIREPILFACGGDDQIWPSCAYVDAMLARLAASRSSAQPIVLRYPEAGHSVAGPAYAPQPPTIVETQYGLLNYGGSPPVDAAARADAWPRFLSFIEHTTGSPQIQQQR